MGRSQRLQTPLITPIIPRTGKAELFYKSYGILSEPAPLSIPHSQLQRFKWAQVQLMQGASSWHCPHDVGFTGSQNEKI